VRLPGQDQERRRGHHSGAASALSMCACYPTLMCSEAGRKSLGQLEFAVAPVHASRGIVAREAFRSCLKCREVLAQIPLSVLAQMISNTIFAISAEESRFTLNGALLILKETGLVMVATDGHRLAMVEKNIPLAGLTAVYRALLPKKAMSEILKTGQRRCNEAD